MEKIFCINCGTKHEFKFAAPKFCSNCGTSPTSPSGTSDTAEAARIPARSVDRVNRVTRRSDRRANEGSAGIDDSIDVETTVSDIDDLVSRLGTASVQSINNFEQININVPKGDAE